MTTSSYPLDNSVVANCSIATKKLSSGILPLLTTRLNKSSILVRFSELKILAILLKAESVIICPFLPLRRSSYKCLALMSASNE